MGVAKVPGEELWGEGSVAKRKTLGSATEAVEPKTKTFRHGFHLTLIQQPRCRPQLPCWGTNARPRWSWNQRLPLSASQVEVDSHGGFLGEIYPWSLALDRFCLSRLDLYFF